MSARQRRGAGDGSLFRRKDGKWAAYVTLPDGSRKYVYGKTRNIANEKLRLLRIRLDRGLVATEDKRTTGEFLAWWLQDLKASKRIAPETWRSYEAKVRLHLVPGLGKIRLAKLSPVDVRQLITTKVAAGLSTKQVNHIHDVLHTALEQRSQA